MKILFITSAMLEQGTFFRCYHFARCLVKREHEVTLVKVSQDSRFKIQEKRVSGVNIVEMPRFWGAILLRLAPDRIPYEILARLAYILPRRFDVVHLFSHHLNSFLPWRAAKFLRRARLFVNDWDDLWTDGGLYGSWDSTSLSKPRYLLEAWLERRARLDADGVTTISRPLYERALSLGVKEECLTCIPSGADAEQIQPIETHSARQQLGIGWDGALLCYAGFVMWDIGVVFSALRVLLDEGYRVKLLLVGPFDGEVKAQCERMKLSDAVIAPGIVPYAKLPLYLGAADIALMPYRDSTINRFRYPNKVGDYLAAGKPIVAEAVGDLKLLFEQFQVGLLCDGTQEDFANKIKTLLEDASLRDRCAKEARRVAEEELSWSIQTRRLEEFYWRLLS